MADAALAYSPALAAYELGPAHPLKPERFTLAVDLLADYGVLDSIPILEPRPASASELERVHTPGYLEELRSASSAVPQSSPLDGLGTADDPVFPGMYDAAALVCGATLVGLRSVMDGTHRRVMCPAGGLHHAHHDHAAGFCLLNDVAVAIADAIAGDRDLRVAYVDIDAHHGDGVQEAFYDEPQVLTVSVHESGTFLFPGTGFPDEIGHGIGLGTAANLPMPPGATDECYRAAWGGIVGPVLAAWRPDVIVAQLGADGHHADPLTMLGLTLPGHAWLVDAIVKAADELCEGRLCATGGGGYGAFSVVPRAWASATARLAGIDLPETLPQAWRERVEALGVRPVPSTLHDDRYEHDPDNDRMLLALTGRAVEATHAALRDYLVGPT